MTNLCFVKELATGADSMTAASSAVLLPDAGRAAANAPARIPVASAASRWWITTGSLIAVALFATGGAQAQALREVVESTLKTNPRVLAAQAQRRATLQDLEQARGGYFPTLDVNAGTGEERTSSPQTRALSPDTTRLTRTDAGVLLSQNLFAGFGTVSEVERQTARVAAATSRLAETREDIALKATEAYLEVLKSRELVKLASENLKAHLDIRDKVRLRVQGGVAQKADLQQALGRVALASSALSARAGSLRAAEANYVAIVGKGSGTLIAPPAKQSNTVASGTVDASRLTQAIRQASDTAAASNPSLGAAKAEVAAAEASVRSAKSTYYPRVNLELNSVRNNNVSGIRGQSDTDTLMLVMRWNLFRGGSDLAQERAFAERRYAAIDAAASTQRDVNERVAVALHAKATSEERLGHLRDHARLSAEVLEAYKQQLDLGRRTLLDVLNAENELFSSRSSLAAGQYDDLLNQYAVEAAKGQLVSSLGIQPGD